LLSGQAEAVQTASSSSGRRTRWRSRGTWLGGLLARKPGMLVRVALANKLARIVWALMARGGVYKAPVTAA